MRVMRINCPHHQHRLRTTIVFMCCKTIALYYNVNDAKHVQWNYKHTLQACTKVLLLSVGFPFPSNNLWLHSIISNSKELFILHKPPWFDHATSRTTAPMALQCARSACSLAICFEALQPCWTKMLCVKHAWNAPWQLATNPTGVDLFLFVPSWNTILTVSPFGFVLLILLADCPWGFHQLKSANCLDPLFQATAVAYG